MVNFSIFADLKITVMAIVLPIIIGTQLEHLTHNQVVKIQVTVIGPIAQLVRAPDS